MTSKNLMANPFAGRPHESLPHTESATADTVFRSASEDGMQINFVSFRHAQLRLQSSAGLQLLLLRHKAATGMDSAQPSRHRT